MPKEKEPKNELILRNRLKEARAEQNLSQSQLAGNGRCFPKHHQFH